MDGGMNFEMDGFVLLEIGGLIMVDTNEGASQL
jgi:hypothetical protein